MTHGCFLGHTIGGVIGGCETLSASRSSGKSKLYIEDGVGGWVTTSALLSSDRTDEAVYVVVASFDAVVIVTSDEGGPMDCCMVDHSIPVGEGIEYV